MFNCRIYLDYASLTPTDLRVIREVKRFSAPKYANPSSIYQEGVLAKKALADARKRTAGFIQAHGDEIVFTSGGTEANGLAIEGILRSARVNGVEKPHLITSVIEHSSVIALGKMLESVGGEVTYISVNENGVVNLDEIKKFIKPNTVLISIMMVNNEIGTIEPIRDIAKVVRKAREVNNSNYPLLHTDASQAYLLDLNVNKLGVDLLTLDSNKIYGPHGVGALYVKRGIKIEPIIYGGGQESERRSGTENIPSIMGFALALDLIAENREAETIHLNDLRQLFIQGLKEINPNIKINPDSAEVSPHILNVSIPNIDNEFFVLQLDAKGISCSTKSSCLQDEDESYVLKEIGADSKISVRFSFGRWTKKGGVKKVLGVIGKLLELK